MSETTSTNMLCPKCGEFQPKAATCGACGVVIARFRDEPGAAQRQADPSAATVPRSSGDSSIPGSDAVSTAAQFVAVALGLVVSIGMYLAVTPKEMGIDEFVEAKKQSFHLRNFRIEGTVAPVPHESYLEAQSSDGRRLSSLKLSAKNATGYVTYDPEMVVRGLNEGDRIRVTGRFERVPYVDGTSQYKQITMALASSIKVIEPGY
jgi:ribosomal protein L37E